MTRSGCFITLEGTEGVGKSTNMDRIREFLVARDVDLVQTREPGGTPLAEDIRRLLLAKREESMCSDTELLLMFAARCQHVETLIKPALARGQWVLSDRFTDASFAYQGGGRQLGFERLEALESWCLKGFQPDLTLWLDLPVAEGLKRARARSAADRFESERIEFFTRVRDAYERRCRQFPERMRRIDASGTPEQVQARITAVMSAFMEKRPGTATR